MNIKLLLTATRIALATPALPRLLAVLLLIALASCGSSGSGPVNAPALQPAGNTDAGPFTPAPEASAQRQLHFGLEEAEMALPVAAPGGISLPDLGELERAASAVPGKTVYFGEEFDASLPTNNSEIVVDAGLQMTPTGQGIDQAAYAIYRFNLPDYDGEHCLETVWGHLPDSGSAFIAVSDFGAQRWRWFTGNPQDKLQFTGSGSFASPNDDIFVVVLLTGSQSRLLSAIRYGGNLAPVAVLELSKYFTYSGAEVDLNAQDSNIAEIVYSYEWDLNGDGEYEIGPGEESGITVSAGAPGSHTYSVRVTDGEGLTDTASAELIVNSPGYDETENNDNVDQADQLPRESFDGWEGNLGPGGNDGDLLDFYIVSLDEPRRLHFSLDVSETLAQMRLFDSSTLTLQAESIVDTGNVHLYYRALQPGNYILEVSSELDQNADYFLSCLAQGTNYDEIENNDIEDEAIGLDAAGVKNFMGNLGAGGHDGDSVDWYWFNAGQKECFEFFVEFRYDLVDIDFEIYDNSSNLLLNSNGSAGSELNFFVAPTAGPYFMKLLIKDGSPPTAQGDYTIRLDNLGQAPSVSLDVSPEEGPLPLLLTFDGMGTQAAPGKELSSLYWDFDGLGGFDLQTGPEETFQSAVLYAPGTYSAVLAAQQTDGTYDYVFDSYVVTGTVHEVEPNDNLNGAQVIEAPVSDFIGVIGPGIEVGGNDDVYTLFTLNEGLLEVTINCETKLGPMAVYLLDALGAEVDVAPGGSPMVVSTETSGVQQHFIYLVTSGDLPGVSGYSMDVVHITP